MVFSCGDSLSAFYGVQLLHEWGVEVTAIGGLLTASPLLIEEVNNHIQTPVFTMDELMTGRFNYLFGAKVVNKPVMRMALSSVGVQ